MTFPGGYVLDQHGSSLAVGDGRSASAVNRAPEDYGADYARLAQIKSEWDPANLFHMDQNIVPKN